MKGFCLVDVVGEMFSCLYLNPSARPREYLQEHLNASVFKDENIRSLSLSRRNPFCCDNADIPELLLFKP